jgi:hypothetical protein
MADVTVTSDVDTFMQSANQAAMRTNIGAGTIATQNANNVSITGGSVTGIADLAIADGGTGAGTASGARTNLEVYSEAEVDAKVATKATAGGVNVNSGLIYFSTMPAPRTNDFSFFGTINKQTAGLRRVYGSLQINGNLLMFISATNKIIVVHWGSPDLVSTDSIELNVDTHIGYTRNGTVGTFYINGKSAGIVTDSRDYLSNFANITATGDGMPGNHKDFKFFNRALSAAEVADLYESGTVAVADRWGGTEIPDWSSTVDGWIGSSYSISQEASFTDSASVTKNNVLTGTLSAVSAAFLTKLNTKFGKPGQITKYTGWVYSDTANIKIEPRTATTHSNASGSIVPIAGEWTQFTTLVHTQLAGYRYDFQITNNLGGNLPAGAVIKFADVEATTLGCIADLPLDEGIGYQFHDRSPNHFDALASTTGVTHLVPKQTGKVRVKAADASSAMYMLRADSILPTDSIISNVLSEQCYVDLTNSAQVLDDYRIRLNPSGSDLQIQRSDGSNHATLGTVTAPSSLSNVDVEVHYEQVAR